MGFGGRGEGGGRSVVGGRVGGIVEAVAGVGYVWALYGWENYVARA